MKKSDLRTGMKVQYRNGHMRLVMLGVKIHAKANGFVEQHSIFAGQNSHMKFASFNSDLTVSGASCFDIMKVWKPLHFGEAYGFETYDGSLIYDREESDVPEYTMEEAIKKVGHTFKIKK